MSINIFAVSRIQQCLRRHCQSKSEVEKLQSSDAKEAFVRNIVKLCAKNKLVSLGCRATSTATQKSKSSHSESYSATSSRNDHREQIDDAKQNIRKAQLRKIHDLSEPKK